MSSKPDSIELSLPVNPLPVHLQECRLRKRFTDITIKVGEEEYPAHKIVLEASSLVMRAWLTDHWEEENNVYKLSEEFVDSEIVEDLLTFFYTAKVKITTENAYAFCMASHYLNITSLLEASERFLSERVVPSNIFDLFLIADKLKLENLRKSCIDCVVNNYETVLKDNRILAYSLEDLKLLITDINAKIDESRVKEVFFECLISWVENDLPARTASLPSLLRLLPLARLPVQFLGEIVVNQTIISDSPICSKILNEAFKEAFKTTRTSKVSNSFKLYCFGGNDKSDSYLSSISCLDVSTGVWNTVNSMSSARAQFGGAIIGKKIYLCGGKADFSKKLDTVEVYDCSTNTTTPLRSLPEPRDFCAAAAINEFIYVSGGQSYSGELSSVIRYNTLTDQWQEVQSMLEIRLSHQLVALNSRLYAISSLSNKKSVEVYNPSTDLWTKIASTQNEHPWAGATAHDGRMYVCSQNGFEVYSPDTNTWQTLPNLNSSSGRTLCSLNGKLWALGGSRESTVHSYDITAGKWTQEPDMDVGRSCHRSFAVPK